MRHNRLKIGRGFTIVELIVVIAVIAILAAITIVGYGSWQRAGREAQVKSDLNGAVSALKNNQNFNAGTPPASISDVFQASDGVQLTLALINGSEFCIEGNAIADTSIRYYIYSKTSNQGPISGVCADRPDLQLPVAPTGLAAVTPTLTSIDLSWTAVTDAVSYVGQCATDQAFVVNAKQASATAPTVTVTVTGLSTGSTQYCRVKAVNSKGSSAWSSSVTTNTNAPSPTGLVATTVSSSQISYKWDAVPGATSYTLEYSYDPSFAVGVQSVSGSDRLGLATGLDANTYYFFRVRAITAAGAGANSSVANAPTVRINWANFTKMVMPGDWDNDGKNDLIVYRPDGKIFLHRNLSTAASNLSFQAGRYLGVGPTSIRNVVGVGRLPSTTTPALLVTSSTGTGQLFISNGSTGASAPLTTNLPSGDWVTGSDSTFAIPRYYNDNRPTAVNKAVPLHVYTFNSTGVLSYVGPWGSGWSASFPGDRAFGIGDWNSDGKGDIAGINTSGAMTGYLGVGDGSTGSTWSLGSGWTGDWVFGGYDIDGDNRPDILRYVYSNNLLCHYPGNGSNGFLSTCYYAVP